MGKTGDSASKTQYEQALQYVNDIMQFAVD